MNKPSWFYTVENPPTVEQLQETIEYEEAQLLFAEKAYRAAPEDEKGYFWLEAANAKVRIAYLKDRLEVLHENCSLS